MSTVSDQPAGVYRLQCREIWGGVQAAETALSVPGIDVWLLSRPFQGAARGGDIHYVGLCGHGRLSRFVVADVSGHGLEVAEMARKLHLMMRRHMSDPDASHLAADVNDEFTALADRNLFATALIMTYDALGDVLTTINAGHPHPLWYRRCEGRWHVMTHEMSQAEAGPLNLPLGVQTATGYRQFTVSLGRGDLVLLYTDSLSEARDRQGELLGEQGLLAVAARLDAGRPASLAEALVEAVQARQAAGPLQDDLTVLTLHHTGQNPPGGFGEQPAAKPSDSGP